MNNQEKTMEKIVALCKNRGFIFAGSDIYGGLANTWDYGPLGARLKNNVKDTWRKKIHPGDKEQLRGRRRYPYAPESVGSERTRRVLLRSAS